MADETANTATNADGTAERIQEANELIGIEGLWSGQILYSGVELGMFTVLDDDPIPARELAEELDLDAENAYRLLRAMSHYGVLDEDGRRQFSLTPLGELFRADHPHSVQDDLVFNRGPEWILTMRHLADIVREGGPTGFVREFGCEFYDYLEENPEFGALCNAVMESASRDHPDKILDVLDADDMAHCSHVCDVGGGHGRLLCHILDAHPQLRGTVLELPGVVAEKAQRWAPKIGVSDRCTYVAGDMFEEVPSADTYFLKWILHNWSDEECLKILSTIHDAASPDGRLFVVETVVPGPETSHFSKRLDITMMVQAGGRERTKEEYVTLMDRTGWEFVGARIPEEGPMSVLEAVAE